MIPISRTRSVDRGWALFEPPDNALALSVDEKTQIQALVRTQPMLPLRLGQIERRTYDYKRHGTASLYAALDIMTGKVIGRITQRLRAKVFLAFLQQIDRNTANWNGLACASG